MANESSASESDSELDKEKEPLLNMIITTLYWKNKCITELCILEFSFAWKSPLKIPHIHHSACNA